MEHATWNGINTVATTNNVLVMLLLSTSPDFYRFQSDRKISVLTKLVTIVSAFYSPYLLSVYNQLSSLNN